MRRTREEQHCKGQRESLHPRRFFRKEEMPLSLSLSLLKDLPILWKEIRKNKQ